MGICGNAEKARFESGGNNIIKLKMDEFKAQKLNNTNKSLISIRQLFGSSWLIYKNRFKTLIFISLLPFVFSVLLQITYVFESNIFLVIIGFIILISWFIILFLFTPLALICAFCDESLGVIAAYKSALSKFKSYLWLVVLGFFIGLGGLVMGIIPIFIFGVWFIFAAYILIDQNLYGLQALLRSKDYVAGCWWKIFWRILICSLIITGISFVIISPFDIFNKNIIDNTLLVLVDEILYTFLLLPFAVAYSFILYRSLISLKPELVNQPIKTKKRFFVFCATFGAIIALLIILFVLFASVVGIGFNKIKQKAHPAQQVMSDFSKIQIYLNDYYLAKKYYPSASKSDYLKFDGKSLVIANSLHFLKDILIKDKDKTIRFYSYSISDDGQSYILGAILEDKNNLLFENDEDGIIYRVNCDDPVYCVKS